MAMATRCAKIKTAARNTAPIAAKHGIQWTSIVQFLQHRQSFKGKDSVR